MKTIIETEVMTFDELDESAKETAREWYREGIGYDEWWDCIYMDAENIGVRIENFDTYRREIGGQFVEDATWTAHKIIDEHGNMCETYKTSEEFLRKRDTIVESAPIDDDGEYADEHELDQTLDEIEKEYLESILADYLTFLNKEWDWLHSDENIDENIIINEYMFTESGKRF